MTAHSRRPTCLSLIAAVTRNGGIGLNNQLLVHLPEDLQHFRRVTMGCPVIMGRKTWDSLPPQFRPLPGRRNVVISRNANLDCPGATVHTSLQAALQALAAEPRVFVIGGAQLYAMALPLADELVLTEVDAEPPADAFFPRWSADEFEIVQRTEPATGGSASPVPFAFVTYRRRG
ncbi:MAG: dihydrofolate reductase [Betaproteobacteria bacterium]|jgi:dihydrofolate reductase|nr:dihydrofolate reductase [Betaproteobacteria bacterium]NBU49571.1 dihydrofolate reductase [Betaproteobacteria bacterium]